MIFDPAPYIEGLKRANERERAETKERARRAMSEAKRLAEDIVAKDSEVKAVYLFGSLATGAPTHLDFDIDLALEGGDVYRAEEVVEDSPFHVDVVQLRLLPEHMERRVRESGLVLARR